MKPKQSDLTVTMAVLMVLLVADWLFVSPQVFAILASDAVESLWRLLPLLSVPRLIVGLCAGLVLAVVDNRTMRWVAFGAYAVLLLWSFARHETYVEWRDPHAAALAVIPYVAGLAGMGLGFALRRPVRRRLNLR